MNFTSEQRKNVPLFNKYKCRVCDKFKDPSCYSKKELNTYTYKKVTGIAVNGITAKLRCRLCSGAQVHELKCQGPCGVVMPLEMFSKQARTNGGSLWCKSCTAWKEAAEPGVTVAPATSTDVAPDEQDTYTTTIGNDDDTDAFSDPEAGEDSGDDYESVSFGYPGTAATNSGDATSSVGIQRTPLVAVPYQGFGALSISSAASVQNDNSSVAGSEVKSQLSTNAWAAFAASQSSSSAGVGTRQARRQAPITYTAYDPSGRAHTQQRVPSDTTSQASNATVVPAPARNNSNWAKPAGSRNVAQRFTTPVAVPPRRGHESSSDDEM